MPGHEGLRLKAGGWSYRPEESRIVALPAPALLFARMSAVEKMGHGLWITRTSQTGRPQPLPRTTQAGQQLLLVRQV